MGEVHQPLDSGIIGYSPVKAKKEKEVMKDERITRKEGLRDKIMNLGKQVFSSLPKDLRPVREAINFRISESQHTSAKRNAPPIVVHDTLIKERSAVITFVFGYDARIAGRSPASKTLTNLEAEALIETVEMIGMSQGNRTQIDNGWERTFGLDRVKDKGTLDRFHEVLANPKYADLAKNLNAAYAEYHQALQNHMQDPEKFSKGGEKDIDLLRAHHNLMQALEPLAGEDFAEMRQVLAQKNLKPAAKPSEGAAEMPSSVAQPSAPAAKPIERAAEMPSPLAQKHAEIRQERYALLKQSNTPLSNELLELCTDKKLNIDQAITILRRIEHFNDPKVIRGKVAKKALKNELAQMFHESDAALITSLVDKFAK